MGETKHVPGAWARLASTMRSKAGRGKGVLGFLVNEHALRVLTDIGG